MMMAYLKPLLTGMCQIIIKHQITEHTSYINSFWRPVASFLRCSRVQGEFLSLLLHMLLCHVKILTTLDCVFSYNLLCRDVLNFPCPTCTEINLYWRGTERVADWEYPHPAMCRNHLQHFWSRIHQEELSRRACSWTSLFVG